jgi:hypothetical protein
MSSAFLNAIKARRTHYSLSKSSPISDGQLKSIIEAAVTDVPSAFNMQGGRAVLLTGQSSDKLWDIVKTGYLKTLGGDEHAIQLYTKKIAEYASGYGTVLFFEDTAVINSFSAKIPSMAPHFPVWSENSTGMLQFTVWTALSNEGLGASLQHYGAYSDEITQNVLKEFNLPSTWKSTAMMPFGVSIGGPGIAGRPKTFEPIEDRVKVFN